MWAVGYVTANDLRRRFPFDIWILVSSALVMADGLVASGLVQQTTDLLMPWLAGQGAFVALVFIFLVALALTELVTNNAAAALTFPLGYAVAQSFGADIMPFVLAVAFGASASFLTPRLRHKPHRTKRWWLQAQGLLALGSPHLSALQRWHSCHVAHDLFLDGSIARPGR